MEVIDTRVVVHIPPPIIETSEANSDHCFVPQNYERKVFYCGGKYRLATSNYKGRNQSIYEWPGDGPPTYHMGGKVQLFSLSEDEGADEKRGSSIRPSS